MTKLYKTTVNDFQMRADGIGFFTQHGEPRTVDGTPMVLMSNGVLVPAADWHAELSDALIEAADRVEALGRRLMLQADAMRIEASKKQKATT